MKLNLKLLFILLVLLIGCHADFLTKSLAAESLKNTPAVSVVDGYLDLRYVENEGVTFCILRDTAESIRKPLLIGLQAIAGLVLIGILSILRKRPLWTMIPFALMLSGAVGNLIDRIRFGHVVDFIHFHMDTGFNWPIFNVADVLINAGVAIFLFQVLSNQKPFGRTALSPERLDPSSPVA